MGFRISQCIKVFALIAAPLLISACRVDVTADLYSEDLLESNENILFPAKLEVEILSCSSSDRADTEADLLSIFSSKSDAKIIGCREDGLTSLLGVGFDGEIASEESEADLVIFRNTNDANDNYFTASLNPNFKNRVDRLLSDNMQDLDPRNLTLRINLRHDIDSSSNLFMISGWIDGNSGQYITETLQKRDARNLQLSNVVSDMVLEDKQPLIFFLD